MKKLSMILLATLLSMSFATSQTITIKSLLDAKKKSDAEITHKKKKLKAKTWVNRAKLYLDIAQYNYKGLQKGLKEDMIKKTPNNLGKAKSIIAKGKEKTVIYDRINLTYVGGVLNSWTETKPIVENATEQSKNSILKAFELDEKGSVKKQTNVKIIITILRDLYVSKGVMSFKNEKYNKAFENLETSLELNKYPVVKAMPFNLSGVTFTTGYYALKAEKIDIAKKYFNTCVEKDYEKGLPYHNLAAIYSKENDKEKELSILEKGFSKYPNSENLLGAFINYYFRSGNSEGAFKTIEKALKVMPDNPSLHFSKGTLYDEMIKDNSGKYTNEEKEKFKELCEKAYKDALKIDPNYFKAKYNLGTFYYNKGVNILQVAGNLPLNQKEKFEKEKAKAYELFKTALPHLEQANKLEESKMTLTPLLTIYRKLGMFDKLKIATEKMKNY